MTTFEILVTALIIAGLVATVIWHAKLLYNALRSGVLQWIWDKPSMVERQTEPWTYWYGVAGLFVGTVFGAVIAAAITLLFWEHAT